MFQVKGVMAQANAVALPFPDEFFHCVCTSPPYYGMRSYSGESQAQVWGGDPNCDHAWIEDSRKVQTGGVSAKQMSNMGVDGSGWYTYSRQCYKCDMWIGALGQEPTPERYAANLVLIFREIARVLRLDGVVWLNLADSHSAGKEVNLANGNRIFVSAMVAMALQADGWTVRQDNIWNKPNPMVESQKGPRWERHRIKIESADVDWRQAARDREGVLDGPTHMSGGNTGLAGHRPKWKICPGCDKCNPNGGYILRRGSWRHTEAHEFIFQITNGMKYFCDQTLVLEEASYDSHGARLPGAGQKQDFLGQNQGPTTMGVKTEYRNPRSVFNVAAGGYGGAHYATFPPDLVAPLIRAATPARACPICGTAWVPVMEIDQDMRASIKTAYKPMCGHQDQEPIPGWVLDPFFGSGTVGEVARSLGVNFAGVDISMPYLSEQARVRAFGGTPPGALDNLPLFQAWPDDGD